MPTGPPTGVEGPALEGCEEMIEERKEKRMIFSRRKINKNPVIVENDDPNISIEVMSPAEEASEDEESSEEGEEESNEEESSEDKESSEDEESSEEESSEEQESSSEESTE